MGTSNFYNKNASNIYSIMDIRDRFHLDHIIEDIQNILESGGFDTPKPELYGNMLSYTTQRIGVNSKHKLIGDAEIIVSIDALIRSGYYEGVNLDWVLNTEIYDKRLDDELQWYGFSVEELLGDWMNKGMAKIHAPTAKGFIWDSQDDLVDRLEQVYKQVSKPLTTKARFSNGNVMYESV